MNNKQTNSAERVDYLKSEMARYAARLDYVQALKIFSELVNLGCQDAETFCLAARYCFDLRNYRLALTLVEQALTISPYHTDAMILKGRILLSQNALPDALKTFEALIIHSRLTEAQRRELRQILAIFAKYPAENVIQFFPNVFRIITDNDSPRQINASRAKLTQRKPLKIGFFIKWPKYSLASRYNNVLGDELYAEAMCRTLKKFPTVADAEIYAPNHLPAEKLDVMIYLNDTPLMANWADKHVLYLQNNYEDSEKKIRELYSFGYDAYIFVAKKPLDFHRQHNRQPAIFLPFGVDTSVFYPRTYDERFTCEVAYVGNDIKGLARTNRFLRPALEFDFALYGNWSLQNPGEIWKNEPYQLQFAQISRGKIPQEDVPALYSTAQINLNCTAQGIIDWDSVTLRTYEVLACKGFIISDGSPAMIEELSDYVVFTDGYCDLRDKIRHYLKHPEERTPYVEKGYNYVRKHATIEARASELMQFLSTL